jgi:hypothetical protein
LNRVYLFFNDIPEYNSELNDSKNKITILLSQTQINNISQLNSSGVVKSITPFSYPDSSKVIIELSSDGKGFTISPLPYSNALMLDVFDWDRLDQAQTDFRQALFAYESGLETTESELMNAIESGSSEAKVFLALHYLKKDQVQNANNLLFESFRDSLKIPDLYAGMAEILKIKGEDELSTEFANQFKMFTGKNNYPNLAINYDSSKIQIPDYFYPNNEVDINLDTTNAEILTTVDTLTASAKNSDKSILEEFGINPLYFIFVAIALVIVLSFLYWTYTKWKKDQINKIKEISKTKFDEEVRKAKEKNDAKANELKRKRESSAKNPKANSNLISKTYGKSNKDIELPDLKQKKVKPVDNVKEEKKTSEIEKFLETYIPAKKEMEKETENDSKPEDNYYEDDSQSKSPNAELAMKLAGEKHKKKQEQLLKLTNQKKSESDIDKTAKDLGLEKGTLETKSSINKLSEDDKRLKKLSNKFDIENKDKNEDKK